MNPFDIIIIIIIGFCFVRGIFRGFTKELASIAGVLIGYFVANIYYVDVSELLESLISNPTYLNIISYMIIFCVVFFLVSLMGVIIKYLLKITFLGWLDRILGAVFGFVKAILIISVLLFMFTTFLPKGAPLLRNSMLASRVTIVSENLARFVSKDMKLRFYHKINNLKKAWNLY